MATQWPVIHGRLVQLLPTLPQWSTVDVFDGPPVTGDVPTEYCTVGYAMNEDSAGDFSHERNGNGFQVDEIGGIRCELVVTTGQADLEQVRATAFMLIDRIEQEIRRDQTLGVLPAGSTTALVVDVLPAQTTAGAQQRLPFTVSYFTRT